MGNPTEVVISTETGPDAPQKGPERPANVPEKFWDAEKGVVNTEALLSSYGELEKKVGAPKDKVEGEVEKKAEAASEDKEGDEALKVAEAAGLDVSALESHWEEHGSLPDDAYEKLASVGVDKSLVDEFVAYRVTQGETLRNDMLASVGGAEAVDSMIEWATKNYTEEKANAFNEGVNSKDKSRIELSLKALKADYDKANGVRPKLLSPAAVPTAKGDTYESFEQLLADQAKPAYRNDPAFRNTVIAKLGRSKI